MTQGLVNTFLNMGISFRDSNGYPIGSNTTPNTVSNGTAYSEYYYEYPIEAGGITIERPEVIGVGGGKPWVKKVARVNPPSNVTMSLSAKDTVFDGYIVGNSPDSTTNSNFEIVAPNTRKVNVPPFIVRMCSKFDLEDGSAKYLHRFYLNGQINRSEDGATNQATGENPNPLSYSLIPNYSERQPWGQTFADNANLTVEENKDTYIEVISDFNLSVTTYIDDGTATADAFSLQYVPASTTISEFLVFNNGVDDSANVSVDSAGSVSLTAANTAGDVLVIIYPIPDAPVATA